MVAAEAHDAKQTRKHQKDIAAEKNLREKLSAASSSLENLSQRVQDERKQIAAAEADEKSAWASARAAKKLMEAAQVDDANKSKQVKAIIDSKIRARLSAQKAQRAEAAARQQAETAEAAFRNERQSNKQLDQKIRTDENQLQETASVALSREKELQSMEKKMRAYREAERKAWARTQKAEQQTEAAEEDDANKTKEVKLARGAEAFAKSTMRREQQASAASNQRATTAIAALQKETRENAELNRQERAAEKQAQASADEVSGAKLKEEELLKELEYAKSIQSC